MIKDPCPIALISVTQKDNIDYTLTTNLEIEFISFTSNVSDTFCGAFSYEITDSANDPLDPIVFTYDVANQMIVVQTSDLNLISTT